MSAYLRQFTKIFTRDEICVVTGLDDKESLTQFLNLVNGSKTSAGKKKIRITEKLNMLTSLTLPGNDLNIRNDFEGKGIRHVRNL